MSERRSPDQGFRPFVWLILGTLASYPLGMLLGRPWLLPVLNTIPAYATMVALLVRGRRGTAVAAMLAWAAGLALCGTLAFALWPTPIDAVVLNGPAYRDEMIRWIRTGEGREGALRSFLPQHLAHLLAFVAVSVLTASTLSITMGAALMNYMSYYVASLARLGAPGWAVVLLGWQPWALCRVAAFCTLGVVLSEPVLSRVCRYRYEGLAGSRKYLWWAGAGIAADWVLKATLAPSWGRWLRALLP